MRGKKLLAGFLSAVMVLGTMSFPAFAEGTSKEVSTNTEFREALLDENVTSITLKNDVAMKSMKDDYNPEVYKINRECTVDLGEHKLDLTEIRAIWSYSNITFKNGTIVYGQVNDAIFHVGNWEHNATGAVVNLEDLVFEMQGTPSNTYFITFDGDNGTLNIDDCTMENLSSSSGLICGNNAKNAAININNSSIKASSGAAFLGGNYTISGTSEINGAMKMISKLDIVGDDVKTNAKASVKFENNKVSYYPTFEDAFEKAVEEENTTIKLLEDTTIGCNIAEIADKDINLNLNGKTLTIDISDRNDQTVRLYSNWNITGDSEKKSKITFKVNGEKGTPESVCSYRLFWKHTV